MKAVKRVKKTKVLGLSMDEKLSYLPHCEEVYNRLIGKWAQICQYSNTQWGFNQRVLTRIIQTIFISVMQYAGHIWLNNKTLELMNKLWYKLIKSAVGATFNIKLETAEIILGLPPLKLQTSINRTKHFLKLNICKNQKDCLRNSIKFIAERDVTPVEINDSMREIFKFLQWKAVKHPKQFSSDDLQIVFNKNVNRYFELSQES